MTSTSAPADNKRAKLDIGILTHNGTHHADEALAVNLLRKLPKFKDLPLTRTRDPALIQQAQIVVDVGAEYDEKRQRFDHHQRGFEETFDAEHKTKLSSAGLVWKHFGFRNHFHSFILPSSSPIIPLLHLKLYDDFIEAIDGIDNGIPQYTSTPAYKSKTDLSSRISYLNPNWNESSNDQDGMIRFEKASKLAGEEFFDRLDYNIKAWLPAREIVLKALEERKNVEGGDKGGRVLDHLFTLESTLSIPEDEKPLYVVYPDESSKWRIQCVQFRLILSLLGNLFLNNGEV
ncbi:hypothetical protein L7F22_029861 [Adiantum nelumboides]|nr:hypothetical protein [Adiantum nelumboides]